MRGTMISILLLVCLPLSSSLATSSPNSLVAKKDGVKLLFEFDDAKFCRIHLSDAAPPPPPSTPSPVASKTERNLEKTQLVLDYEEQVERMHLVKRAQPTISDHLDVVYEDESVVVINKPAGVLCVPDINKNPSLLDLVWNQYGKDSKNIAENPSSMIVNRLDMDTSGLVVFGRLPSVTRDLNEAFRERVVLKEYEALVCGHVLFDSGLIDLPLQRDHEHPPFMRVSTPKSEEAAAKLIEELKQSGYKKQGRKKSKLSQTLFRVVERLYHPNDPTLPVTRLRLKPKTGRTHQLRVHCAAIGHPIVGDATYGLSGDAAKFGGLEDAILTPLPDTSFDLQRAGLETQEGLAQVHPPNVKPMCLHAAFIRIKHPVTGETAEWMAPVPF
jgi:tRNA pseudouridine32 synthase/23S rRNA pseudouridine746 synthase